ncbi:hypothetical protein DOTSEDRAFT_73590 [Dothistroma septosporum NZE10]|uniref:Mid2 domain-containing protein n=1 Tax=Dothistroma septosporum (strain NZE10 / CBS 128990) TaxID=675120 RepID=N1PI73_DOTSN|nr:hypothetical protein DOTSEDRAFT_73590 [Dothistroma septosporum NZE10]
MIEAERKKVGTCVAGCEYEEKGERELRRAVEMQRLAADELLERRNSPDGVIVDSLRSGELVTASTSSADRNTTTNSSSNEPATTTDAAIVETTTFSNGLVSVVTLDAPTGAQTVVVPTAPSGSVPFNTYAGTPSSTIDLPKPTTTDSSNSSSIMTDSASQQSKDNDGGLSESAKIGLGVGIGVGVPLLLALIACLLLRRRKKQIRGQILPKCEVQGHSDLSMAETPHQGAMSASREPLYRSDEGPMKQLDYQQYHVYHAPPPINTFADEEVCRTPISATTRSELRTPAPDGRPMSRHIAVGPPVLTIPEPDSTPFHSRDASIDGGVSPVSPVSPISAVSPVGSRGPSPKREN